MMKDGSTLESAAADISCRVVSIDLPEPYIPDEKIRGDGKIIGWAGDNVGILVKEIILDVYSLFSMR